jgi:hypothetical protein
MFPIRIGMTCKEWGAAIIRMPRAWRLDKLHLIPYNHVNAWIKRSGDRRFTLTVPPSVCHQWIIQVRFHRERVDRLVLSDHHDLLFYGFPNLTVMELSDHYPSRMVSPLRMFSGFIRSDSYPSLKSLHVHSMINCTEAADNRLDPIPIINLVLECQHLPLWHNLLVKCSSIVTLTLTIVPPDWLPTTEPAISFPNLLALNLSANTLRIPLSTPQLTFLRLGSWNTEVLSAVDVSHVTSLIYDTSFPEHHPYTHRRQPNVHHTFPSTERILVHGQKRGRIHDLLLFLSSHSQCNPKLSEVFIPSGISIPDQLVQESLAVGIIIRRTEDTLTLEDRWRSSHAPHK